MSRAFDVVIALVALVVLSPFLLAAALAIKLGSRGPVLYRQRRVGLGGREFEMLKLRTMAVGSDPVGVGTVVTRDDPRVTGAGRFLRRTSLDEIPNLVNVLRGEMAIVGPRPTIPAQVDDYTPFQKRRHEVLPGITGWAQVQGRAGIPWEERIELDVWYVNHRSAALDLRILAKTAWLLVTGHGLSPEQATTPISEPPDDTRPGYDRVPDVTGRPNVSLRRFEPSDVAAVHRWFNNPEAIANLMEQRESFSMEQAESWTRRAMDDSGEDRKFAIVVEGYDEPVGFTALYGLFRQTAPELGALIGDDVRGKGVGRRAEALTLAKAFDEFGAHRVYGRIPARNEIAKRTVAGLGWKHEGTMRAHLRRDGEPDDDCEVWGVLPDEFRAAAADIL